MVNLLTDTVIPVVRQDGSHDTISVSQLAETANPVMQLAWPRSDLRNATMEFLIGVMTTALNPTSELAWKYHMENRLSVSELKDKLASLVPFFNLDGSGPRFMQDHDPHMTGTFNPISSILIDTPGENTKKNNADVFIKREENDFFGPAAAGFALYALQTFAPSGGQGNRTGYRGGGPLTTIVYPRDADLLATLLANISTHPKIKAADYPLIFPWLAPTITSEKGKAPLKHIHKLQVYFAMPRRIRLEFANQTGSCAITGEQTNRGVVGWTQKNYGVDYIHCKIAHQHPLTPHFDCKNQLLAVHAKLDNSGWDDYLGLVVNDTSAKRSPASNVAAYRKLSNAPIARLHASGYAMDNMKVLDYVEQDMPLPGYLDAQDQEEFWHQDSDLGAKATLWVRTDGAADEIVLPKRRDFADFDLRMAEVLTTLAKTEARSQLDILRDVQTASADLVRLRAPARDAVDGSLAIEAAVSFVESARDLMLAAACAAIDKRSYFATRKAETHTAAVLAVRRKAEIIHLPGKTDDISG